VCQFGWKFISGCPNGAYRCQSELVSKLSSPLQNNFYCYQSKKAEDKFKQAKFKPPGKKA
jgi:hypothetical protein